MGMSVQPVGTGKGSAAVTGIGRYPARPLHQYWLDTVKAAVDTLEEADGEGWAVIETAVYVKHRSPGWVDGFRVQLSGR
jgi:hypothetical protein